MEAERGAPPTLTRRRMLQLTGAAAVGGVVGTTSACIPKPPPETTLPPPPPPPPGSGRRVAVFGAGVAGLSAAHELAERGFEVVVHERDHLGGKAWSVGVPESGTGGRTPLPGEHGFRFFPGFYKNLGDTMRRTPLTGGGTPYDRLVRCSTYRTSFADRPDVTIPLSLPATGFQLPEFTETVAAVLLEGSLLTGRELGFFAAKLAAYVSSCDARRLTQWEHISWRKFVREDEMSDEYRNVVSRSLVRNLAATKSSDASTHSIGLVGLASVMSVLGQGNDVNGTFDRVLDGPTSEVWLDHWVEHMRSLGVTFRVGSSLESLAMEDGRVSGATVRNVSGRQEDVDADYFVCAMPLERAGAIVDESVLAADPALAGIARLRNDWMVGLQFYLRSPLPLANGHVNYVHSPFAVTSISQAQFWTRPLEGYGDGTVRECLSTIVSDWETPGILYGKTAQQCTAEELAAEVWAQMKEHLNDREHDLLTDDMLHSWFLDPAITYGPNGAENDTPLFIQNPGSWYDRPNARTAIPNLAFAGDWVRTNINVTTMDGANQGGRAAANAILLGAWSEAPQVPIWNLLVPPVFEPLRAIDYARYLNDLPNMFDPDQLRPSASP